MSFQFEFISGLVEGALATVALCLVVVMVLVDKLILSRRDLEKLMESQARERAEKESK